MYSYIFIYIFVYILFPNNRHRFFNNVTCVCSSLFKINAPTNPVAPVRSTLPQVNLFLFSSTALQNERRAISGLKILFQVLTKYG